MEHKAVSIENRTNWTRELALEDYSSEELQEIVEEVNKVLNEREKEVKRELIANIKKAINAFQESCSATEKICVFSEDADGYVKVDINDVLFTLRTGAWE